MKYRKLTAKLCTAVFFTIAFGGSVSAAALTNDIKYVKVDEQMYDQDCVIVARRSNDGSIIPLSYESNGYCYAYVPDGGDIECASVRKRELYGAAGSYDIGQLVARGVINGFDDSTIKPYAVLTRAQMAAIFARLFSVAPSDTEPVFADVPNDAWYAGYVSALTEKGVFAEDELFYPDSPVTREQLTAMTYRMLSGIGALDENLTTDLSMYRNLEDVSDYAVDAYRVLIANGYEVIYDTEQNVYEDLGDDEYFLSPNDSVSRDSCIRVAYSLIHTLIHDNAPAIKRDDAPDVDIPILDGSTSTYDITQNIYWCYYLNHQNHPSFPKAHSKTSNAYKRLIDGEVDMIFVPDPSEDIRKYAEERGVTLKYIPIANEALVFFTASENTAESITTEQLNEIYVNNGINNWSAIGGPNAELVPFCRNNDSGSHAQMEKFILNGGEINDEIEREHISLMMASILTDVERFNQQNPGKYAIGYSLYYYYQNVQMLIGERDLKLLSIDGTAPTDDTIGDGTYPYTTNYYAVIRDENDPDLEAFAELMQGEFGDDIIRTSGMGVIR